MKISVVINTYNSERYLSHVLEAVKSFDEILICDMHSTDRTIAIAEGYKCTIVYHEKTGYVEPARNFAIQSAKYEWVLVVDSDELVTLELRDYLYQKIEDPNCPWGIRIPRKNYFMGRFMHGSYPDYILRFFRKEKTSWPAHIHKQPIINGSVETIPARKKELAFIHLANESVSAILQKTNVYTDAEIEKRKSKKYGYFSIINDSLFRFIKHFFFKGGYKDGKAGLIYCGLLSVYKFISIAKIWESDYHRRKK